MKTIEERAKLAAEGYEDDGYSAGLYMGYIVGAKEQKAIENLKKAMKDAYNKTMEEQIWNLRYRRNSR